MAEISGYNVTEAQRERLTILMEECAEVIQAASKILRHGWDSKYDNGKSNREQLELEMGDVQWCMLNMAQYSDFNMSNVESNAAAKAKRMLNSPYLHHQKPPVVQDPMDGIRKVAQLMYEKYLKDPLSGHDWIKPTWDSLDAQTKEIWMDKAEIFIRKQNG
jgi:NTP pyrophosphatase (non-canonical NTP hydrolase)